MDYRRLEAFCKVFELKSFSRAGDSLSLSQPTISAHVAALERELGVRLFDRLGRDVQPTSAGEALYRKAKEAFLALEGAREEIRLLRNEVAGTLELAASTIPAHYLLPPVLAGFRAKHGAVRFRVAVGDSRQVMTHVMAGDASMGLTGMRDDVAGLSFEPLLSDDLVLMAPPGLVPEDALLSPHTLLSLPWVLREEGSGTRRAMAAGLAGVGVDIRALDAAAEVCSTLAVLECVRAGLGVSATSRMAAGPLLARGEVAIFRVKGLVMERDFFLVRRSERVMFPVGRVFLEHLRACCAQARI